jgi:serine/threonine-protein kinase
MDLEAAVALLRCARRPRGDVSSVEVLPGSRIGNYEIVGKCLAPGGSGYVYPATELHSGGRFALKLAKPGLPLLGKIFQEERHKARLLNHPNILGAHDGGVHEGRPYLVFRRLDGHLTEALRRERFADDRAVLGLMLKLVGAVRFAHARTVLHCDLKPSNILFDSDQEPHVADFGLARTIAASGSSGEAWGGTPGWMSPEQVARGSLGVQSDVFTLGVILYWLLTDGQLPWGDGEDFERRQLEQEPQPIPRKPRFSSALSWDLAVICRKAMQKDPERRYQSAFELESDFERAAHGRLPLAAGSRSSARSLRRWVRRHPLYAAGALLTLGLPVYALSVQNETLSHVRSALRPQSLFSADAQARAVVSELYAMSLRVHAMAQDPEVVRLIAHGGIAREAPPLRPHAAGFDSVNVFSSDGAHQARWPAAPNSAANNVRHAEHFACAERLAVELLARPMRDIDAALPVCVAGAHLSKLDDKVKLGLSAPLLSAGRMLGVVEASTMARDSFGALQMSCGPGDCFTALLGARDRDAPEGPVPGVLSILAQRGVPTGREIRLSSKLSRVICERLGCAPDPVHPLGPSQSQPFELELYVDPVSGAKTVATVAPVARTGLSVLIATPYSAAHSQLADIAGGALHGAWVPLAAAAILWLVLLFAPNPRWPWHPEPRRGLTGQSNGAPFRPESP